jgi:hypothetical protein
MVIFGVYKTTLKMKGRKFSEMSTEELLKSEKVIKMLTGMLLGSVTVLLGLGIFLTIRNGFNVLIVVPLALLPVVVLNANSLREIKKEKQARGL